MSRITGEGKADCCMYEKITAKHSASLLAKNAQIRLLLCQADDTIVGESESIRSLQKLAGFGRSHHRRISPWGGICMPEKTRIAMER